MFNFDFLEKVLGLVSPPHFVYDLSKKIFLTLYSINWQNFIAWLPLLPEILASMYIVNIGWPVCDVINFKSSLKVGHWPSKKVGFICFKESALKMMNNAFYFIVKALVVLKIFTFLSWLSWLCRKMAWSEN